MPRNIVRFSLALAALYAVAATAHDLWIEPSSYVPAPATRIAVRLRIGQLFQGDPFPRDPKLMRRFAVLGAAGETAIPGVPETDPAGFLVSGPPGLYELVYTSDHASVTLDAAKFASYLSEEGLDKISALRAARGLVTAPAKEIFSRCAKSLIQVGGGSPGADRADRGVRSDRADRADRADRGSDERVSGRVLGLRLELVPEKNPYTLAPGDELPVRLLYEGAPLAGAKVAALCKDQPARQVAGRTDAQGRVRLRLDRSGVWMVKAVNMIAAPAGSGADWESFWASLTFALPAATPPAAGRRVK